MLIIRLLWIIGWRSVYIDFKDSEAVKAEECLETMEPLYGMKWHLRFVEKNKLEISLFFPPSDKLLEQCQLIKQDS